MTSSSAGASRLVRAGTLAGAVLLSSPAGAEPGGFALDRYEPAERGSRFFGVDTLDLRGHARPAVGATLSHAEKPLLVYDATGEDRAALVRRQTMVHVGGSLVLFERLRVAAELRGAAHGSGDDVVLDGAPVSARAGGAFGDVRLAADLRVQGRNGDALTTAVGTRVWLPTGSPASFTGDGVVRAGPQLLASGVVGAFAWGARLGVTFRAPGEAYGDRPLGSEAVLAVGAGALLLGERLLVGPELSAATTLGSRAFSERGTPVEALVGAHHDGPGGLRLGVAAGLGLTRGDGAPLARLLLSVAWAPRYARPDRDADGIVDEDDACPGEAGVPSDEPTSHGCPPPPRIAWEGPPESAGPPPPSRPLAIVTPEAIHITEEIRFATDSAALLDESEAVLDAVRAALDAHPDILRVRIEGHTDDVGGAAYNDRLSARRAAAVEAWLVDRGVDAGRLESVGRGSREPVDTNDTEAGRARNRRVVFTIVQREAR